MYWQRSMAATNFGGPLFLLLLALLLRSKLSEVHQSMTESTTHHKRNFWGFELSSTVIGSISLSDFKQRKPSAISVQPCRVILFFCLLLKNIISWPDDVAEMATKRCRLLQLAFILNCMPKVTFIKIIVITNIIININDNFLSLHPLFGILLSKTWNLLLTTLPHLYSDFHIKVPLLLF